MDHSLAHWVQLPREQADGALAREARVLGAPALAGEPRSDLRLCASRTTRMTSLFVGALCRPPRRVDRDLRGAAQGGHACGGVHLHGARTSRRLPAAPNPGRMALSESLRIRHHQSPPDWLDLSFADVQVKCSCNAGGDYVRAFALLEQATQPSPSAAASSHPHCCTRARKTFGSARSRGVESLLAAAWNPT